MLLSLRDVTKTYPAATAPVLSGVSLDLGRGQMLALTGESGSGKSTLLHLIGGLDTADQGVVAIDGNRILVGAHPGGASETTTRRPVRRR